MAAVLNDMISKLHKLSPDELQKLKQAIIALQSMGGVPIEVVSGESRGGEKVAFVDDVLSAISDFLHSKGVEYIRPSLLRRFSVYSAFVRKMPGLAEYINRQNLSRNGQRAVIALGVRLLYENLSEMGLPVSSVSLMSHIHRMPAVLNRAFPGYAESGMLSWVVGQGANHV